MRWERWLYVTHNSLTAAYPVNAIHHILCASGSRRVRGCLPWCVCSSVRMCEMMGRGHLLVAWKDQQGKVGRRDREPQERGLCGLQSL